jgi:hypothetical protein
MARDDGPERAEDEEVDELRREAAVRREAVKRTAAALEDRLRERSEQVGEVFDRTRDRLHQVDDTVTKYRYLFVGGAVGVGLALARRRRPAAAVANGQSGGVRYVMVERPTSRPGLLRSLAGGLAALALRQGMDWVAGQMDGRDDDDDDAPLLPSGRRRR